MGVPFLSESPPEKWLTYKEGRHYRKIWYPVWSFSQKDHQEDGDNSTWKIHMFLLRKGSDETSCCWYLGMCPLQKGGFWWCLRIQHHCCCHCTECCTSSSGNQGDIN